MLPFLPTRQTDGLLLTRWMDGRMVRKMDINKIHSEANFDSKVLIEENFEKKTKSTNLSSQWRPLIQ